MRTHWIVDSRPAGSTGQPAPITLTARLVGAFSSVREMKQQSPMTAHGIAGDPIHLTDQSFDRRPVSEIRLSDDVRPGQYGLA